MKTTPTLVMLMAFVITTNCNTAPQTVPSPSLLPERANFQQIREGKQTDLFYLKNDQGMKVSITNYGARLVSLIVPDEKGNPVDVILGFDNIQGFIDSPEPYFGATIGRYGNRIAEGKFSLDGTPYTLAQNNGPNSLHGGPKGFHNVVWEASQPNTKTLILTYSSPHLEEGFPGNLQVKVQYTVAEDTYGNALQIDYEASSDKKTISNLTNHAFFNLNGEGSGKINDHKLMVNAERYTPVDDNLIPLGEHSSVEDSPFDFRISTEIGKRVNDPHPQMKPGNGYDHNFVLVSRPDPRFVKAATVWGPKTGIIMDIFTEEPGLQFYGGNFLDGSIKGKGGKAYEFRSAFCLETQHFPDSPNQADYPSVLLEAGDTTRSTSIYRFLITKKETAATKDDGFISLINENMEGWYTFLKERGKNNDPNQVFQVKKGELHVSGEDFGYICTEKSYENFHFKVDFKWGTKRWKPRAEGPRDSGICYFFPEGEPDQVWPKSLECQIQEADCGDYWMIDSATVVVRGERNPPKPFTRFFKTFDAERPHGEWNTVEVICQNGNCQHIVNGVVVNEGSAPNLTSGKILLQSEGAEMVFRNVRIKEFN